MNRKTKETSRTRISRIIHRPHFFDFVSLLVTGDPLSTR